MTDDSRIRRLEQELARLKGKLKQPTRPHRNLNKALPETRRKIDEISAGSYGINEIQVIEDPDENKVYLGLNFRGTFKKIEIT